MCSIIDSNGRSFVNVIFVYLLTRESYIVYDINLKRLNKEVRACCGSENYVLINISVIKGYYYAASSNLNVMVISFVPSLCICMCNVPFLLFVMMCRLTLNPLTDAFVKLSSTPIMPFILQGPACKLLLWTSGFWCHNLKELKWLNHIDLCWLGST